MNTIVWLVAGGALAWLAYAVLHINRARGLVSVIAIGMIAAYFGGSVLTPMFSNAATGPAAGEFDLFALVIASSTALAVLYLSNSIYERFGA